MCGRYRLTTTEVLMCGRYRLTTKERDLRDHFGLDVGVKWLPRWNIAPTQMIPTIRQHGKESVRIFSLMRWGLIPYWTLLAKSIDHMTHSPSFAKVETRVGAGSSPFQKSDNRCKLIAAAIAIFCKRVLDSPRYRERRIPTERTPCEMVASMLARLS